MNNKLLFTDLAAAARLLRTDIPEIRAVAHVEGRGAGFMTGRAIIRFEGHVFRRLTGKKFDLSHPTLSHPYMLKCPYNGNQVREYKRLAIAMQLDPEAAMQSCSWGMFQIMGFHYRICGFKTIHEFVDAMKVSVGQQLEIFCKFLISQGLDDELREHRWAAFALRYNGTNYKGDPADPDDDYDVQLEKAYNYFCSLKTIVLTS
jgi:hypothetical protein